MKRNPILAAAFLLLGLMASAQTVRVRESGGGGTSCASPCLTQGLVHYWSMDEASGSREDTLHPGTVNAWSQTGSVLGAAGLHNNAASIDPNKYLSILTSTLFPSKTFTLVFWIKPVSFVDCLGCSPSGAPILVSDTHSAGLDIYKAFGTTDIGYTTYPSGDVMVSGNPLATGSWHLVIAWFNEATRSGAIRFDNGTPQPLVFSPNFIQTIGNTLIAFNDPAANMTALVDEMLLYNINLSASQQAALWSGGTGAFYPFS